MNTLRAAFGGAAVLIVVALFPAGSAVPQPRIVNMEKINLLEKFGQFTDQWSPKVVGEVNDTFVKLARVEGEFVWHHHDTEDELFLVVKGELVIKFRDRQVTLGEGEMCIVPRGVEHLPVAAKEAWILLLEPKTTLNTGNLRNDRTVADLDSI